MIGQRVFEARKFQPRMFRIIISRYWLLLPLLLVAVLIHNFAEDWEDGPVDGVDTEGFDMRSTQSDYYLEAFKTRKYDVDGRPEYRVSGDSLTHYPGSRRSDIIAPSITLIEPEGEWRVSARRAVFNEEPELFRLVGDVVVVREGDQNLVIRTRALELLPDAREVRTDEAIEIVADTWQLRAVGLRSTLATGNVKLLNKVTGTYAAPALIEN